MSSDTKWIIGTVVAMTAVVVSVLTLGVGRSLASIDERIDTVNERIDIVDERIDGMAESIGTLEADVRAIEANVRAIEANLRAIDDKFGKLNTTLLFLTTCIVDLEGPLPVVAAPAAALTPEDQDRPPAPLMPPQVTIELPGSCPGRRTPAPFREPVSSLASRAAG